MLMFVLEFRVRGVKIGVRNITNRRYYKINTCGSKPPSNAFILVIIKHVRILYSWGQLKDLLNYHARISNIGEL